MSEETILNSTTSSETNPFLFCQSCHEINLLKLKEDLTVEIKCLKCCYEQKADLRLFLDSLEKEDWKKEVLKYLNLKCKEENCLSEGKIDFYCLDCNSNLCKECKEEHLMNPKVKGEHNIISFKNFEDSPAFHCGINILSYEKNLKDVSEKMEKTYKEVLLKNKLNCLKKYLEGKRNEDLLIVKFFSFLIEGYHLLKELSAFNYQMLINLKSNIIKQFYYNREKKYDTKRNTLSITEIKDMGYPNYLYMEYSQKYPNSHNIQLLNPSFNQFNQNNCYMFINDEKVDFTKTYYSKANEILTQVYIIMKKGHSISTMQTMFKKCYDLTLVNFESFDTSKVTSSAMAFENCENLVIAKMSTIDVSTIENMFSMFEQCINLESLDVSYWDMLNVRCISRMFFGCGKLKVIDISNWDTTNLLQMTDAFYLCKSVEVLDISKWNLPKLETMKGAFSGCKSIHVWDHYLRFKPNQIENNLYY